MKWDLQTNKSKRPSYEELRVISNGTANQATPHASMGNPAERTRSSAASSCTWTTSGSGKTLALVDMLIRLYKGCFARIYIFSPSVDVDSAWLPVKKYVEEILHVDPQKEQCFFDTWDTATLHHIVESQKKLIEYQKNAKHKKLHGICIVCDDFADDPRIMHTNSGASSGGSMLNTLFVRGRHLCISTLVSSQKLRLVSSTIRVNLQFLCVWRLRNQHELEA